MPIIKKLLGYIAFTIVGDLKIVMYSSSIGA